MSTESKYPVAVFELITKGSGSGFIREDTVNTQTPIEIIHPKNRAIINKSVVREKSSKTDSFVNVPIRYIYGSENIKQKAQTDNGEVPNPKQDRITFVNGFLTVPKDGATVGLYDFMTSHAQNLSNSNRLQHLEPIFKEIKPAEDAKERNFNEFVISEAVMYIRQLCTEKADGSYSYDEARIEALANQFNVAGNSASIQIEGLLYFAKTNPKYFLTEAKKTEQIAIIEVSHGLKLKIISFEGNVALSNYGGKVEKIKAFAGKISDEKKPSLLANYYMSIDGKDAYELFKAELSAAKEANISQQ